MAIYTDVRFRPVAPLDRSPGNPVGKANERWREALQGRPGVLNFKLDVSARGAASERQEALPYGDVPPADVTITWRSLEDANALFSDNSLFEYLCGGVACAPSVRVIMEDGRVFG